MIELTKNDLLIVGDINPKLLSGYRSAKNYSRFVQGGFVIANLEGAIVENLEPYPKTGKPRAGSPDEVDLLCTLGVQAVSLANNHLIDYGPAGIKTTCRYLASVGVGYFGVGRTVSDAMTPFFVKVGDAWVALIGIAQNEFGAPYGGACGEAAYNERDALCAIWQANDLGADRVIVLFHAGIEYVQLPSPAQRRRCHFLVEAGADAVICQHSHIAGPIERYEQGWISYGTGDFFATSRYSPHL